MADRVFLRVPSIGRFTKELKQAEKRLEDLGIYVATDLKGQAERIKLADVLAWHRGAAKPRGELISYKAAVEFSSDSKLGRQILALIKNPTADNRAEVVQEIRRRSRLTVLRHFQRWADDVLFLCGEREDSSEFLPEKMLEDFDEDRWESLKSVVLDFRDNPGVDAAKALRKELKPLGGEK